MDAAPPTADARSRMVALALSYVGCGVALDRARYLALVAGPADTDEQIRGMLGAVPGCALVVRGLLRAIGCKHERLLARCDIARASLDIIEIARDAGAWCDAQERGELLPCPGDVVVSVPTNQIRHNYVVIERGGTDLPCSFLAVEGGQLDRRRRQQIVGTSARRWEARGQNMIDVSRVVRHVEGWCNLGLLAERWPRS